MKRLVRFLGREDGIALILVVLMITVLTLLSVVLLDQVTAESQRAATSATSDAVYQAAEAGVNDYIAKLTDDPQYYDHCVAKGETTRRRSDTGALVHASATTDDCDPSGVSAWKAGVKWTYPTKRDRWFAGTGTSGGSSTALRGYAYNLMVEPPYKTGTTYVDYITVVSTGCKVLDPNANPLQCDPNVLQRAVEVHVRRSTPADFQFMMTSMGHGSGDVCWASKVYGKMYSAATATSPGDIYVCGATFYGDVMAEGKVYVRSGYANPPNLISPARIYDLDHPNIRVPVPNPISFSDLQTSLSDVQRAAAQNSPTTDFEDSTGTISAWRIIFTSDGNMRVWKCKNSTGTAEGTRPYCNDIKLSANVTLKSSSSTTVNVNESTGSFPNSGTIYIGNAGSIDTAAYTGKGSNGTSFTGVTCSACGSGAGRTHSTNETVSLYPSGQQLGFNPVYNDVIPSNGAVYTAQDAVISWPSTISNGFAGDGSSVLNGRVGVASGGDMVIAGNIHYASESGGSDDDVLGLIAQNNFWLGQYAPNQLWFRAATIALKGLWGDYDCNYGGDRTSSSSMTFVGTSAYYSNSGCMQSGSNGYDTDRVYRITDNGTAATCPATAPNCATFDALKFLFPPWFPVINGTEQTVLFREVPRTWAPADVPAG